MDSFSSPGIVYRCEDPWRGSVPDLSDDCWGRVAGSHGPEGGGGGGGGGGVRGLSEHHRGQLAKKAAAMFIRHCS